MRRPPARGAALIADWNGMPKRWEIWKQMELWMMAGQDGVVVEEW
jgi:hypothetical protein